jgi:N-acetylglucosamine kinase-like BadF-type ATPase
LDLSELTRRVAALAPRVIDLARQGDPAARRIVDEAVKRLIDLVRATVCRLDAFEGARHRRLVCAGGLLAGDGDLYRPFSEAFGRRRRLRIEVIRLSEPASLGALALGEEEWGRKD